MKTTEYTITINGNKTRSLYADKASAIRAAEMIAEKSEAIIRVVRITRSVATVKVFNA